MPLSEWKEYTLDDIIELIGGGTPKTSIEEFWNGDVPWLSVVDFNSDNRFVFDTEKKITELGLQKSSTKLLNKRDLIISARGTVGALAQLAKPMAFNQSCYGIRGTKDALNDFLYYLIKYKISDLQSKTHGSVFNTITRDTFSHIKINLPPLSEQQAIAEVLGSLDDKIELNRKMNKTLEDMAQAIFKSWFVDSEEDFKQGKLVDDFNIVMGQSPAGNTYNEDKNGLPFYQGSRDFTYRYPSLRVWCSSPCRLANAGDTLMSVRAPVGALNMAIEKCCIGRGLCAIRHKSKSRSYTYYFMQNIVQKIASSSADGTVFDSINKITLENLDVIIPPVDLINKFEEKVFELDEKNKANFMQIQTLVNLRDTLLPKLISGELRIPDAEKLVEGVV